jgi:hypothetical protein
MSAYKSIVEIAEKIGYSPSGLARLRSSNDDFPEKKDKRLAKSKSQHEFLYDEAQVIQWMNEYKNRPRGTRTRERIRREQARTGGLDNSLAQQFIRMSLKNHENNHL